MDGRTRGQPSSSALCTREALGVSEHSTLLCLQGQGQLGGSAPVVADTSLDAAAPPIASHVRAVTSAHRLKWPSCGQSHPRAPLRTAPRCQPRCGASTARDHDHHCPPRPCARSRPGHLRTEECTHRRPRRSHCPQLPPPHRAPQSREVSRRFRAQHNQRRHKQQFVCGATLRILMALTLAAWRSLAETAAVAAAAASEAEIRSPSTTRCLVGIAGLAMCGCGNRIEEPGHVCNTQSTHSERSKRLFGCNLCVGGATPQDLGNQVS